MANRVIQQKIVKMRRRKRYMRFSGSDSVVDGGNISLSKQVINVGLRIPGKGLPNLSLNQDRAVLNPKKDLVSSIPKSLRLTMDKDLECKARIMLKDQDLNLKKLIFDGRKVKVFIFFDLGLKNIFLFKYDIRMNTVQRSCNFSTLEQAQDAFSHSKVLWLKFTVEPSSGN